MKARLEKDEGFQRAWAFNPHVGAVHFVASLPFYKSRMGTYVHIVRSGKAHYYDEEYTHTSFNMWCGTQGYIEGKGALMASNGDNPFCATCVGRAVGAGVYGERMINGMPVLYQQRLLDDENQAY